MSAKLLILYLSAKFLEINLQKPKKTITFATAFRPDVGIFATAFRPDVGIGRQVGLKHRC